MQPIQLKQRKQNKQRRGLCADGKTTSRYTETSTSMILNRFSNKLWYFLMMIKLSLQVIGCYTAELDLPPGYDLNAEVSISDIFDLKYPEMYFRS